MKRTAYFPLMITLIVLCLTSTSQLFAQDEAPVNEKNEEHHGLKAGINFAELWGEDALPESDRKVGNSFGVYALNNFH